MGKSKVPIFLALDIDDVALALQAAEKWSPYIQGLKVGPRLGFQLKPQEWEHLANLGELFIDYKFFDIPSTVERAVERAFNMGASFVTVHALNGGVTLKKLKDLELRLSQQKPFKVLCVTLLTSFDQEENTLPLSEGQSSEKVVQRLSQDVFKSGLRGLVCSPLEADMVKRQEASAFCVCPGVRFSDDERGDQSRILTPEKAWKNGADYLVMGRSLLTPLQDETSFEKSVTKVKEAWQGVG